MRRLALLLCACLAAAGLTALGPAPALAVAASLKAVPTAGIAGEPLTLKGRLGAKRGKAVQLQRKSGKRWVKVKAGKTGAKGAFTLRTSFRSATTSYRVRFAKGPGATKAVTARTLKQSGALTAPASVSDQQSFAITAAFKPVRAGRMVEFFAVEPGGLSSLGKRKQNSQGKATFTVPAQDGAQARFRARALAFHGAAPVTTAIRTVSIEATPPSGFTATEVTVGDEFNCGLRFDTSIWCWGFNGAGQLGDGTNDPSDEPVQVAGGTGWSKVDAGSTSACAIKPAPESSAGTLWCWGSLGAANTPQQIGAEATWTSISVGDQHACAIKQDSTLWCWGEGLNGRLGSGNTGDQALPHQESQAYQWISVSAGLAHTCAIRSTFKLYCWGEGAGGKLGRGSYGDLSNPSLVGETTPVADYQWSSVSAGGDFTCASSTANGNLCWGSNAYGQFGDGSTDPSPSAVASGSPGPARAGGTHTCALSGSTVWCWGAGDNGQVGDGTGQMRLSPVQIATGWSRVEVGRYGTCGIDGDGAVWCWGGGVTDEPTPVPLPAA